MPRQKAAAKAVKAPETVPRFTKSGLARAWGLSASQVTQWAAAGLPVDADGKISLDVATRWLRQWERREKMRSDGSDASTRRADAEAQLMELKLAREMGDVVPASEVYATAEEEAVRVRAIVAQLASTYAPLVATRLACSLRDASAALRDVADGLSQQMATDDDEQEAA